MVDTGRMTIFTNRPGVRERTHNDFNIFGISNGRMEYSFTEIDKIEGGGTFEDFNTLRF